jgi:hypothetical protein
MSPVLSIFGLILLLAEGALAQGDALSTTTTSGLEGPRVTSSTKNISVQVWLNPSSVNQYCFPFYLGDADSNGFGLVMHDGVYGNPGPYVSIFIAGVQFSATGNSVRLPLNQWTNVTLTRGDSVWHLYQNGELVGRGVGEPRPIASNYTFFAWQFQGQTDEARIWDRELTIDEIRATLVTPLHGDEAGLLAYYPMDTTIGGNGIPVRNKAVLHPETPDLATVGIDCEFVPSTAPLLPQYSALEHLPAMTIAMPSHYQFFARGSEGTANTAVSGSIDEAGYDSVFLQVYRNDTLLHTLSHVLSYSGNTASFDFEESIPAELALTIERLYVKRLDTLRFLREAADLTCGDVYLICGQSNSHPSNGLVAYESPYLRSFGIQTGTINYDPYDPSDTLWGLANGHGFFQSFCGPYMTGEWGIDLQQMLQDAFKIPICVINGGAGSSTIEQNIRNNAHPMDLTTIYGKALYRATKSGLAGAIKAIFWYQGESNTLLNYDANFHLLYSAWLQDYPSTKKYYIFQIRPGCTVGTQTALREFQRNLGDTLPNIRVMSTVSVVGHDGCHYTPTGYDSTAAHIFRLVAQDFYGSTDTVNIEPPSLLAAFFTSSNQDTVACLFTPAHHGMTWPADTLVGGRVRKLADYFYVGTDTNAVTRGWFAGDTLYLKLNAPAKHNTLTYLPDTYYNTSDSLVIYEGPWLVSARGIGALSFANVPILPAGIFRVSMKESSKISWSILPNPSHAFSTISIESTANEDVSIALYDDLGRFVSHLYQGRLQSGPNAIAIDLSNYPSGMYFVRIVTPGQTSTRSVLKLE